MIQNYRVHLCYLDGVESLIGRYRWRYEIIMRQEMYREIVHQAKKGMTGFRYRQIDVPYSPWIGIDYQTAKQVVNAMDDRMWRNKTIGTPK